MPGPHYIRKIRKTEYQISQRMATHLAYHRLRSSLNPPTTTNTYADVEVSLPRLQHHSPSPLTAHP